MQVNRNTNYSVAIVAPRHEYKYKEGPQHTAHPELQCKFTNSATITTAQVQEQSK